MYDWPFLYGPVSVAAACFIFLPLAFWLAADNPKVMHSAAESAYFIGYIVTIGCLVALGIIIKEQKLLEKDNGVEQVLSKGAAAITSTVAGLVVMFILRSKARFLEDRGDNGRDEAGFSSELSELLQRFETRLGTAFTSLDQFVGQLNSSHSGAFADISKKIGELGTGIDSLSNCITKILTGLAGLEQSSNGIAEAFKTIGNQSQQLVKDALTLESTAQAIGPAWEKVNGYLANAANLSSDVTALSSAVAALKTSLDNCNDQTTKFTTASKESQAALFKSLEEVSARSTDIGTLTESIRLFTTEVRRMEGVPPVISQIVNYLKELDPISKSVQPLATSIDNLNQQLTGTASSAAQIATNARNMTDKTDRLVLELGNQVPKLLQLSAPLAQFSATMSAAQPGLEAVASNVKSLEQFTASVVSLEKALKDIANQAESSPDKFKHYDKVIAGFTDFMLKDAKNLAKARTPN